MAQRFVVQGDLADREDLFYLTYDEMKALAAGHLQEVRRRGSLPGRTEIEADALISPPSVISGDPHLAYRSPSWSRKLLPI